MSSSYLSISNNQLHNSIFERLPPRLPSSSQNLLSKLDFVDLLSSEGKKIRMFSPSYQVSLVEVALQQLQCESVRDKD